jgi:hypothetical protein
VEDSFGGEISTRSRIERLAFHSLEAFCGFTSRNFEELANFMNRRFPGIVGPRRRRS